jgi:hypothetical protein
MKIYQLIKSAQNPSTIAPAVSGALESWIVDVCMLKEIIENGGNNIKQEEVQLMQYLFEPKRKKESFT